MPSMLAEILEHKKLEIQALKAGAVSFPGTTSNLPPERGATMPPCIAPSGNAMLVDLGDRRACMATNQMQPIQPEQSSFVRALTGSGLKIVAEIKPSSPSGGMLREDVDLPRVTEIYNSQAAAISVLTDSKYFGGSFSALEQVAKLSGCPVLCKDFIIDTLQIQAARNAGASAVLLIVKALSDQELLYLNGTAIANGLVPVIEVQNMEELKRGLKLSPKVILINNRNLDTLEIDLQTTIKLAPLVPPEVMTVSASGIRDRHDIEKLKPVCSRFLIGSALMRADDIEGKLKELLQA